MDLDSINQVADVNVQNFKAQAMDAAGRSNGLNPEATQEAQKYFAGYQAWLTFKIEMTSLIRNLTLKCINSIGSS